jgi:predicted phage terminase large subunit-like protein
MTPQKIEALRLALPTMSMHEKVKVLSLLEEWERREDAKKARNSLLTFVKRINPAYKIGPHHKILAHKLEAAARGELDRLATAIAPRFGKSLLLSLYFPAWFMGNFPEQKLIISSHTADLAVDFGKKVRNLLDTKEYKEIFPGVTLASDSKSAGRWNTSKGGEFFACLRHHSKLSTSRGKVDAVDVRVGDVLYNSGKNVRVKKIYNSTHAETFNVAGLLCSSDHPIWTLNRGWVFAKEILATDLLRTESFSDRLGALLRRAYGYLEHSRVPSLVQHQVSLRKPEQRKIFGVWWTRNFSLRKMATFRQFCGGYGGPTFAYTHGWQERQQWTLQPRKLSVGDARTTSKQSTHKCASRGQNPGAACARNWNDARSAEIPHQHGKGCVEFKKTAQKELETYSPPENLGRIASGISCIYARCSRKRSTGHSGHSTKKYLESAREAARKLCGFLLGVRAAGNVTIDSHKQQRFVNFLTDGDHTFFADGVLTHNCGVGGAIAGRGADLLILDDVFSEQDILAGNYDVFDKVYDWYAYGARTRLMPGGRVVVLHTRWAKNDLIGRLLDEAAKNQDADQWEYIEFPAILNEGTEVEKSLWPEQWSLEALRRTRASMPTFQWQAQYQQSPTSQQGALIKKEWWRRWTKEDPPECEYIIMSLDAAQEVNKRSDFTALTTWGVFYLDADDGQRTAAIILLNAINKRMEFPALKDLALKEYKNWQPDCFIIEKKSNGAPLSQELRRMGIPIQDYTPSRGAPGNANTKYARVNSVADIVRSGLVWAPDYKWAEEVIEQCNDFPSGKNDDLVDTCVMSLMRFRSGGFITLPSDEDFDTPRFVPKRSAAYY